MHEPAPARHVTGRGALAAGLLILVGAAGVQSSSALSIGLFDRLSPIGTSGARMLVAAALLLVLLRPRVRGRTRREWLGIAAYGVSIALMNLFLYLAIARVPLGVATTIDFLGPILVVVLTSRRAREWLLALFALAGVALITGFGGDLDPLGLVFAACAGAFFGAYTFIAPRIGSSRGGVRDLALSVTVAALILLPFGAPALVRADGGEWLRLAIIALLGTAIPFFVDTLAGKLSSAGVIGIFFAFDPTLGTVIGALFLGQSMTAAALAGIALVIVAGAGIVWSAATHRPAGELPDPAEVPR